jgi:hypothetical protein
MPDLIEQPAVSGGHGWLLNGIHLLHHHRHAGLDPASFFFFFFLARQKKVDPGSSPG